MKTRLEIIQGSASYVVHKTAYGWLVNSGLAFVIVPATSAPQAHAAPLDAFVDGRSVAGLIVDAALSVM